MIYLITEDNQTQNAKSLTIDEDTKIVFIDKEEVDAQAEGDIQEPQGTGAKNTYYENVYYVADELDSTASVIFIDYTNSIDEKTPADLILSGELAW